MCIVYVCDALPSNIILTHIIKLNKSAFYSSLVKIMFGIKLKLRGISGLEHKTKINTIQNFWLSNYKRKLSFEGEKHTESGVHLH